MDIDMCGTHRWTISVPDVSIPISLESSEAYCSAFLAAVYRPDNIVCSPSNLLVWFSHSLCLVTCVITHLTSSSPSTEMGSRSTSRWGRDTHVSFFVPQFFFRLVLVVQWHLFPEGARPSAFGSKLLSCLLWQSSWPLEILAVGIWIVCCITEIGWIKPMGLMLVFPSSRFVDWWSIQPLTL